MTVSSGEGTASTSGAVTIRSVNGGEAGSSGVLVFSSGSSSGGNSGSVLLGSSAAAAMVGADLIANNCWSVRILVKDIC